MKGDVMQAEATDEAVLFDRRALTVAVVIGGVGAILMSVAALVGGLTLLSTCRRWVGQMETGPREQARQRADQLRAATSAGFRAWKEQAGTS
jgi:hypothetical protein